MYRQGGREGLDGSGSSIKRGSISPPPLRYGGAAWIISMRGNKIKATETIVPSKERTTENERGEGEERTVARVQLRSADRTSEPRLKVQNSKRRTRAQWLWLDRFSVGRSDGYSMPRPRATFGSKRPRGCQGGGTKQPAGEQQQGLAHPSQIRLEKCARPVASRRAIRTA